MQERVAQQDLLALKPGESKVYLLPSELARHSAQTTASNTSRFYPRADVLKYACKKVAEADGVFPIMITAVPK